MIRSVAVTAADGGTAPSTVRMGETIRLYAQATRNNASKDMLSTGVTWASKDTAKATVSNNGTVTPVAVGTARINATADGITSPDLTVTVTPTLGALTVTAAARTGGQTITVKEPLGDGNMRRYLLTAANAKPTVAYDTVCDTKSGWADLPANGEITGTAGQVATVVEMTTNGAKARAKGEATLPATTA